MRFQVNVRKATALALALILTSFAMNFAYARNRHTVEYTYKVHNKSKSTITKLLASEDGKTFGAFDIGEGIAPGATVTLVWDKSTDNGNCEWWIKAEFDDGGESPAKQFDFCEKDLVLEFS